MWHYIWLELNLCKIEARLKYRDNVFFEVELRQTDKNIENLNFDMTVSKQ